VRQESWISIFEVGGNSGVGKIVFLNYRTIGLNHSVIKNVTDRYMLYSLPPQSAQNELHMGMVNMSRVQILFNLG